MVRVVAAGHVNWDVTLALDRLPGPDDEALIREQHRSGGGSAANVTAALAGLGVSAGVVGCVGDDDLGSRVREELLERGVDCTGLAVREGQTTVKYLLVADDGAVAVLGNEGLNEALAPEEVPGDFVGAADHLHLTSQPPATAGALAEVAVSAGCTVSFDPGRRAGDRDFRPVLDRADVVFATEREARALFAVDDEPAASADLDVHRDVDRDLLVVVTRGPGGASVHDGASAARAHVEPGARDAHGRGATDDASEQGATDDASEQGATDDAAEQGATDDASEQGATDDAAEQGATDDTAERGADGEPEGGAVLEHAGFGVTTVDTSGAGDAFAAGFLSVWLEDRGAVERALEVGNACGALASRARGARSAPKREALEAFLAERS